LTLLKYFLSAALFIPLLICGPPRAQFMSSCAQNDKIEPAKRQAIEAAATGFSSSVVTQRPDSAYDMFTAEAKRDISRQEFQAAVQQMAQVFGELTGANVRDVYLVKVVGIVPPRVVCGDDISRPQGWVAVSVRDVSEQAHVIVETKAVNNTLALTLWLTIEDGQWRVYYFQWNVTTLADKSVEDIWLLARRENDKDHAFNSWVLLATAAQLSFRGPHFQLGLQQAIQEDSRRFAPPAELQGQVPYEWKSKNRVFRILQVGPIAVGGKVYLLIAHETEPWSKDEQAEQWNQELIEFFSGRFPEYSDVFAGLVVRAHERGGGRGFGTVREVSPSSGR